jgi:phospholipid transport system substrate-binding protein
VAMKKSILGWIGLLVVLGVFPFQVYGGVPLDTIQDQVNQVLDVLRDPTLQGESAKAAKEEKIWAIINNIFDYDELSKRTLGRNWKKLNADQQKEFSDLFSELLGTVYMDRILEYTDENVVFDKETMLAENKSEVRSKIITKSAEIPINYRMVGKNGQWKVYDVIIEGVSLIKNYRTQFREILMNKSPEDLLEILRKKVS